MPVSRTIQLGKQGVSNNFIQNLKNSFKTSKNIKISILKSAREDGKQGKKQVKEYAEIIKKELGENYNLRTIGFTICIKKLRNK